MTLTAREVYLVFVARSMQARPGVRLIKMLAVGRLLLTV